MNQIKPNCFECPSLLSAREAAAFFSKSIGTPVCAKFGKPLGTPRSKESERRQIGEAFASSCSEHGKPRPISVDWKSAEFQVMLPDPLSTRPGQGASPDSVRTCLNCSNLVDVEPVAEETGWPAAICAAKGKLVLGQRFTIEARGCEYRSLGQPRQSMTGLTFIPEYQATFKSNGDPVAEHAKNKANFVDPVEYVSDKPVSDEDKKHGIRAWRRVSDPISDNEVWLPIYDLEFFDADERSKIPRTGDDEHPEDYIDHFFGTYKVAALWTELDETPALWGQAGTGKTELFRHLAWLMCLPFERISITGSTELDDLAGKWVFEGNETKFEYGRLPRAWMKPSVIVIDEPNTGPPDVWQFIRPLTDNSKQLVLDMAKGERINRHADAFLGMAMNPAWDMKNVGANMIGDADANRLMHMAVALPDAKLEREIITTRCKHDGWEIPKDKLDAVMGIATDIRDTIQQGGLTMTWAIRPQIKVARALRWFDWITAYRMAAADFLEPEQAEQVIDIVKTYVEF